MAFQLQLHVNESHFVSVLSLLSCFMQSSLCIQAIANGSEYQNKIRFWEDVCGNNISFGVDIFVVVVGIVTIC